MLRLGTACRGKKSYPDRALPLWSPVVTCFKSMINLVEAAHGQGPTHLTWYKAGDGGVWTQREDTGEERPASEALSAFLPHVQRDQGTDTA